MADAKLTEAAGAAMSRVVLSLHGAQAANVQPMVVAGAAMSQAVRSGLKV